MHRYFACALVLIAFAATVDQPLAGAKGETGAPFENMDRAQTLVYNLNHMKDSSGYYLLDSIKQVKDLDHEIGKALFQVQEVDKTYAKLRGRRDDRFLEPVAIKLQKAQQSRAQLLDDLQDAYAQLKTSIQDTLITDQERKKH
ncbi:MAG TPA: hypothetical protein V6C72_17615 [Chroococcales cyanobacterium]